MSFCGSIVSNDYPQFEGTEDTLIDVYNHGIINKINSHYSMTKTMQFTLNCSAVECFKFRFVSNTIDNLNMMKEDPQTYFDHHVNWQMQKFGLAIHLKNFKGIVDIIGNSLKNTLNVYNDICLIYD